MTRPTNPTGLVPRSPDAGGGPETAPPASTLSARRMRQVRAQLDRDVDRARVVEDYAADLVEVRLVVYARKRARSEMHQPRGGSK